MNVFYGGAEIGLSCCVVDNNRVHLFTLKQTWHRRCLTEMGADEASPVVPSLTTRPRWLLLFLLLCMFESEIDSKREETQYNNNVLLVVRFSFVQIRSSPRQAVWRTGCYFTRTRQQFDRSRTVQGYGSGLVCLSIKAASTCPKYVDNTFEKTQRNQFHCELLQPVTL